MRTRKSGLARAIGTDQAEQLALVYFERDVVERDDLLVAFGQRANFDGGAQVARAAEVSVTSPGIPILSTPLGLGT